jgi:Ni,Fe-hydrogenase I cytochrome b subunit
MNAQLISALLLLMVFLTLALTLLFLALKIQPFSMQTLSYFLMSKKQNGSENVIKKLAVFLVLLMLNVMTTTDAPLTLANNNTALVFLSIMLGAILNWRPNQFTTNLFLD